MKNYKAIYLANGKEDGYQWQLKVNIGPSTTIFCGGFCVKDEEDRRRNMIRDKDRKWFIYHLGSFMNHKQVHHEWNYGETCYIVSEEEHRLRDKKVEEEEK